jgi:hypothetical protein
MQAGKFIHLPEVSGAKLRVSKFEIQSEKKGFRKVLNSWKSQQVYKLVPL